MKKYLLLYGLVIMGLFQSGTAAVADEEIKTVIEVVQLREDSFLGALDAPTAPPHQTQKVEKTEGIISQGIYTSPYQGYQIRIPRVSGNNKISVHQALVGKKADGTVATSHVLFIPDSGYGVAGIVVTRLREDRPKDSASILAKFAPKNLAETSFFEKQGVVFKRFDHPLGSTLQRTIRNRAFSWHFPYRVAVGAAHPKGTLGVTRYVVNGDFFYEFSLIVNGDRASGIEDLQVLAEQELDELMNSMIKKAQ